MCMFQSSHRFAAASAHAAVTHIQASCWSGWSGQRASDLIRTVTHYRTSFCKMLAMAQRSPLYALLGNPSTADMQWAFSHVRFCHAERFPAYAPSYMGYI